jgi:hypothetical protein
MAIFDQLFGRGGYSGIAFQQFVTALENKRASQGGLSATGGGHGGFSIENMSSLSNPHNYISERSEYSEENESALNFNQKQKLDNLITL